MRSLRACCCLPAVPSLLDEICAPSTNASECLSGCMATCTASSLTSRVFITPPTAAEETKLRVHYESYTAAELTCSEQCAASCQAAITTQHPKAAAALALAAYPHTPLYVTWLSIFDQCANCDLSVRSGVRYATPAEAENLHVLKVCGGGA